MVYIAPMVLSDQQLGDMISRLVSTYEPEKVLVFGSYAHGTAHDDSDLDLIVVKNDPKDRHTRQIEAGLALGIRPVPVDLLVFTPEEAERVMHDSSTWLGQAFQTARVVYER